MQPEDIQLLFIEREIKKANKLGREVEILYAIKSQKWSKDQIVTKIFADGQLFATIVLTPLRTVYCSYPVR